MNHRFESLLKAFRTNEFGETEHLEVVPIEMIETTQGQVDDDKVREFMENMPDKLPTGARYGRADRMVKLRDGHHRLEAERRNGAKQVAMWVVDQGSPDGLTKSLILKPVSSKIDGERTRHNYEIEHPENGKVGYMSLYVHSNDPVGKIGWIGAGRNGAGSPNAFGPGEVKSLARQLRAFLPHVLAVDGTRVSGTHFREDKPPQDWMARAKLPSLQKSDEEDHEYVAEPAARLESGRIFSAAPSHASVIKRMKEAAMRGEIHPNEIIHTLGNLHTHTGYMTTHGRFVNRQEAFHMARMRGQLNPAIEMKHIMNPAQPKILYSEDYTMKPRQAVST